MFISTSRYVCLVIGTIVFALNGPTVQAETVTIVANPGPFTSIEKAAVSEEKVNFWDDDFTDDGACTESFAAVELRHFLAACLDMAENDIKLAKPGTLPSQGNVFILGNRASNPLIDSIDAEGKDKLKSASSEAFRIHTHKDQGRTIVIIEGKTRIGTLYGTYDYLEQLGMKFYGLGEQGTVYPAKPVTLPDKMDLVEDPKYITRGYYSAGGRGDKTFFLWAARNHMNLWSSSEKQPHPLDKKIVLPADTTPRFRKKLGFKLISGGHGVQENYLNPNAEYPYNHEKFEGDENKPASPYKVSPEYKGDRNKDGKLTYGEAHPEWYAQLGGKRKGFNALHLTHNYCTSNDEATRELAKNLIQSLIDGEDKYSDMLDFWMLDGLNHWCECQSCQEQGTFSDRLLDVQYKVYKEIKKAQSEGRLKRNVQLLAIAYLDTLDAPTKQPPEDFDYDNCLVTFFPISRCYAHALADPSCTEINLHTLKCYQKWATATDRPYKGSMVIGEYYNVSSIKTLPVVYTHLMSADIPWYYRTGVRHLNYMHTPTRLWGTWTLNQRLLAKLLWNPQADVDALLADYFRLYYPTTSERTRRFYEHLEYATRNIKAYKHHVWVGNGYHCLPGKLDNIAKDLFPMDHLQYASHHPTKNDAPDVVDIIEAMNKARREIDDALLECTDQTERLRLLEDERRFAYGEAMFRFLYHLVRIDMFHHRGDEVLARHEFESVERWAERLRGITDVIQVSYRHANARDGLEASQADPAYQFFKKKYGQKPKAKAQDSTKSNSDPFMAPKK